MIYRPAHHLLMWDTWMLEDDDCYHLFTLAAPCQEHAHWDRVCHQGHRALWGRWVIGSKGPFGKCFDLETIRVWAIGRMNPSPGS